MNERIKLLAEQANILTGKDSYGKFAVIPGHEKDPLLRQGKAESYDALEKFAELIVKECMKMCDEVHRDYGMASDTARISKRYIKKHFGVEE